MTGALHAADGGAAPAAAGPGAALPGALPQLVAVDLDSTLLDARGRLSERNTAALAALAGRGVRVLLCTGRPPRLTTEIGSRAGVELAVCYNGASTVTFPGTATAPAGEAGAEARAARETTEHHLQLPAGSARRAIETLRARVPGVLLGIETHHGWYLDRALWEQRRPHLEAAGAPLPDDVGAVEDFVRDAVIKILARHPEHGAAELARELTGASAPPEVYATWSGERLLELMHPDVNKRWALERLARRFEVPRARSAAFGDQRNDREMLRWVGFGVAMGNASPEARAAADAVAPGNDDDGVAAVIEGWLDAFGPSDAPPGALR